MSECTCNHRNEGGEERPEEKNRAVSGVRGLFALSPVMVLLVVYLVSSLEYSHPQQRLWGPLTPRLPLR